MVRDSSGPLTAGSSRYIVIYRRHTEGDPLMDAMYWEHPIDLDKIRRLVGWRQMTGGRGRRGSGPGGPGGGPGSRGAPGGPGGPGGFGRGAGAHWMGPLFGGMRGGPGF